MANKISTKTDIPNDLEKEKFVLGAMLIPEKGELIIPNISSILSADDFYRPEHKLIFKAILKISADNKKPTTLLTLYDELRTNVDQKGVSLLDKIGIDYVLALTEVAHTTAYAEYYSKVIKEKAEHRKLIELGEQLIENARAGLKTPLDIIGDTTDAFNKFENHEEGFFNVGHYLFKEFSHEIHDDFQFSERKSGFNFIDSVQLWKPGLYILGATPACGKTTFAWQLLEQFAENGENCIFCSYEMSKKELVAKTLARRLFKYNPKTTLTASDILSGGYSSGMVEVAGEFFDANLNFTAKKFNNDTDVNKLLALLRPIVNNSDKPPIVCIDYIQRLIPRDHKAADTRSLIDDALFKLKDFSQETNTTFIGISTFNRTNYNTPVSFENFKESGGIEYTADVVLAMQLNITDKLSGENVGVIRQKIDAAKRQQPREINLRCLKNRYGNNYDACFQYFSAHDYFKECTEFDFISNDNKSNKATSSAEVDKNSIDTDDIN